MAGQHQERLRTAVFALGPSPISPFGAAMLFSHLFAVCFSMAILVSV
jgi:hypothetical protein